jgi:hypothetical protein
MKLISDAKDWWRFWSMRLLALWSASIAAWPMLTEEQRASILTMLGVTPEQLAGIVALTMFVSIASARVTKQNLET